MLELAFCSEAFYLAVEESRLGVARGRGHGLQSQCAGEEEPSQLNGRIVDFRVWFVVDAAAAAEALIR